MSWAGFAREIFRLAGKEVRVVPIKCEYRVRRRGGRRIPDSIAGNWRRSLGCGWGGGSAGWSEWWGRW